MKLQLGASLERRGTWQGEKGPDRDMRELKKLLGSKGREIKSLSASLIYTVLAVSQSCTMRPCLLKKVSGRRMGEHNEELGKVQVNLGLV